MPDDYGLQALAQLQALDARERVQRFRDEWMDGAPLADVDAALAWMVDHLGAPAETHTLGPCFNKTYDQTLERWRQSGFYWAAKDSRGEPIVYIPSKDRTSPMRRLGSLVCFLGEAFGREWVDQGAMFVLADRVPELRAATFVARHEVLSREPRDVSGPLSQEIVLFVRPQATLADVSETYRRAQERLIGAARLQPRERIKPMTSPRMRDLAVLGGRIAIGAFDSWADALAVYESEHADDPTYHDGNKGRFRRDVRTAYKRVTGLDLDFQPDKRGTP
ncbi:MAG: hypothetical protein Q8M66_09430, partial [Actinomycetota bacterium]|nr:hypothetical protein [Actinomycetota bacterium]